MISRLAFLFFITAAVFAGCFAVPSTIAALTNSPLAARPDFTVTWGLVATGQLLAWGFALVALGEDIRASARGPLALSVLFWGYAGLMLSVMLSISVLPVIDVDALPPAWRLDFERILGERMVRVMVIFVVIGCSVGAAIIGVVGRQLAELDGRKSFRDLVGILGRLRRSFSTLAILLSLAVFSTSRLYAPISRLEGLSPRPDLTQEIVLNYGLLMSFLLVLFYLPVALRYQQVATAHVNDRYRVDVEFNAQRASDRHAMEQALGLTVLSGVEGLIGALGPALSALLSLSNGK